MVGGIFYVQRVIANNIRRGQFDIYSVFVQIDRKWRNGIRVWIGENVATGDIADKRNVDIPGARKPFGNSNMLDRCCCVCVKPFVCIDAVAFNCDQTRSSVWGGNADRDFFARFVFCGRQFYF